MKATNLWMNLPPGGRIYEQRNFIYKAINDSRPSAVKPKAGLYIFPKIDRDMYRVDDDVNNLFQNSWSKKRFSWFMAAALTGKIQITSGSFTFHVSMS